MAVQVINYQKPQEKVEKEDNSFLAKLEKPVGIVSNLASAYGNSSDAMKRRKDKQDAEKEK